jgi:hypothetical protein
MTRNVRGAATEGASVLCSNDYYYFSLSRETGQMHILGHSSKLRMTKFPRAPAAGFDIASSDEDEDIEVLEFPA